jgi:hypothetical protein
VRRIRFDDGNDGGKRTLTEAMREIASGSWDPHTRHVQQAGCGLDVHHYIPLVSPGDDDWHACLLQVVEVVKMATDHEVDSAVGQTAEELGCFVAAAKPGTARAEGVERGNMGHEHMGACGGIPGLVSHSYTRAPPGGSRVDERETDPAVGEREAVTARTS